MSLIVKDKFRNQVIANGSNTDTVRLFEGNWYYKPEAVDMTHLVVTERTYNCPYKGICYWIDLQTPDGVVQNIAWVYRDLKPGYEFIKDEIGFYARETSGTIAVRGEAAV